MTEGRAGGLRGLFSPPVAPDVPPAERARTLNLILWVTIALVIALLPPIALLQPAIRTRVIVTTVSVSALCAVLLGLNRAGWTRLAGGLLVGGLVVRITMNAWEAGGIRSPGVQAYFVFALLAALLLGERAGVLTAIACVAISFGFVLAEIRQVLPPVTVPYHPAALWLINAVYLALILLIMRMLMATVGRALRRAESELAERRRTEAELRESEQRLRLALDSGRMGVWQQDFATGRLTGDVMLFDLLGLPRSADGSVDFPTWLSRIHSEDRTRVTEEMERFRGGLTHAVTDFRVTRPDGTVRHVHGTGSTIKDEAGRAQRIVGMATDVTDRFEAQRERERLIRDLTERVKELRLLHAAARLLHPGRPVGRDVFHELVTSMPAAWMHPECCEARIVCGDIEVTTPGWRETPWRQSTSFTAGGRPGVIEVVYLQERPPEAEGPFLAEERALLGSLVEMLVAYVERDHAEARRIRIENQMRQVQKMEALGQLAGSIAHDFNNMLSIILGFTQLAESRLPEGDEGREHLKQVAQAGESAVTLVKQILAFSRRQELRPRPVDLAEAVTRSQAMVARLLGKRVRYLCECAGGTSPALVDPGQFEQVVLNLSVNARDAMPDGGTITVRVRRSACGAPRPDGTTGPVGEWTTLEVQDTGTGMPPEVRERIFEPFFTTKEEGKGTGLGLATVHGIVTQSGGFLEVESEVGRGSTFRAHFPVAHAGGS